MKFPKPHASLLPSLPAAVFLLTLLAFALLGSLHATVIGDGDAFAHLRLGNEFLQLRSVPQVDLLSHTREGQPYIAYGWGSEVVLALLHRAFGIDTFIFFAGVLVALTAYLILKRTMTHPVHSLAAVGALLLGSVGLSTGFLARPHLFSWVGFALILLILDSGVWRRRHWSVPVLTALFFAVWVNMHPGCLIVLGLLVIEFAALGVLARVRHEPLADARWGGWLTVCAALGTLINPFGWKVFLVIFGFVTERGFNKVVAEHLPVTAYPWIAFVFAISVVYVIIGVRSARLRQRPAELAGLIVLALLGASAVRHVQFFVIASSAAMALGLQLLFQGKKADGKRPEVAPRRRGLGTDLAYLLAGVAAFALYFRTANEPVSGHAYFGDGRYPVKAVEFLRNHRLSPGTKLFHPQNIGGFLEYALPEVKTYSDGRAEFFGLDFIRETMRLDRNQELMWHAFSKYGIDWAIVPAGQSIAQWLLAAGWNLIYQDERTAILSQAVTTESALRRR